MGVTLSFSDDADLAELAGAVRQTLSDRVESLDDIGDDPDIDATVQRLARLDHRINDARLRLRNGLQEGRAKVAPR